MATMTRRTVWVIHGGSIQEGIVIEQRFAPADLNEMVVLVGRERRTVPSRLVYLTPKEAIKAARALAELLNRSANDLADSEM